MLANHSCLGTFFIFDRMSSIYLPNSVLSDFMSVKLGGPVHVRTRSIWFKVELPGNSGRPLMISPIRQPKLHTSTAFEYFLDPNKISGARYHLVAMYSVKKGSVSSSGSTDLTSPKSHILALQFSLTRIFEGLISR